MFNVRLDSPETATDYATLVAINNAAWPDRPGTVEEWMHDDKSWPTTHRFCRFVVEHAGRIIAEGAYMEPFWIKAPGKYYFGYSRLPEYEAKVIGGETVHDSVYRFLVEQLSPHPVSALLTSAREDKTFRVGWLEENGFTLTMRMPVSELNVETFDFAPYAGIQNRMAARGIHISSLQELQSRDPDWLVKAHEMCMEIDKDVPSPDPPARQPLEEFEKIFQSPNFRADGWFIAEATTDVGEGVGPYVGVSMLGVSEATPEKMYTWLTGVLRPYRRKGLATALKVSAIEFAGRHGAKVIQTDNEENNPMFQLNLALGFKPIPAWLTFEKQLGE